jgi:hypothetical protein
MRVPITLFVRPGKEKYGVGGGTGLSVTYEARTCAVGE